MNNINELFDYTKERLNAAGLIEVSINADYPSFEVPERSTYKQDEGILRQQVFGYDIRLSKVYKHNAAGENVSVRLYVEKWNKSCGTTIVKVKYSYKDSIKKINRLIDEVINTYKTIINEKAGDI